MLAESLAAIIRCMAANKKTRNPKKVSRSTPRPSTVPASSTPRHVHEPLRSRPIDDYLARVSPSHRALLDDLRRRIHSAVPEVAECISYRLPAFRYRGRVIAGFSATSHGCSYYPFSGTTLKTLADDIEGYSHTKGALHFGPEPLPPALVRKLLRARIAEGPRLRAGRAKET